MAKREPLRIVFDTNVVVSALLFSRGTLSWLRDAWAHRTIVPVTSQSTLRELTRVLAYPKFRLTADDRYELLGDYLPFADNYADDLGSLAVSDRPACRDPHDQIFVDLAIASNAAALVSGDQHIQEMSGRLTIPVWSPIQLKTSWS